MLRGSEQWREEGGGREVLWAREQRREEGGGGKCCEQLSHDGRRGRGLRARRRGGAKALCALRQQTPAQSTGGGAGSRKAWLIPLGIKWSARQRAACCPAMSRGHMAANALAGDACAWN